MAVTASDAAPKLSRNQHSTVAAGRRKESPGIAPTVKTAAALQPLDSSIVNEAIPQFFIGRNKDGFWVARDAKGKRGGLFLFKNSALSFARRSSRPRGCATIYLSHRFELDLENRGNPLVAQLARFKRLATLARQRVAALSERFLT
jgi:hypothetical protein